MPKRIILAGHSHAFALGLRTCEKALVPHLESVELPNEGVFGLIGPFPREPLYWEHLVTVASNSTLLLVWAGNQHLARFLFNTGPDFDFHLASHPEIPVDPKLSILPESLIRDSLSQSNDHLERLLRQISELQDCTPVLLGTPPPKSDDVKLRAMLSTEEHFVRLAQQRETDFDKIPFTRREIRRKLWIVTQDLLCETAQKSGCAFIAVPPNSIDSDGFLKSEYCEEDVTHANTQYGSLFWKTIVTDLERLA